MNVHTKGKRFRLAAFAVSGVVALGGAGVLASTADASPGGSSAHTANTPAHSAKAKHTCRVVVGDPYKSGGKVKANGRFYCKKRGNLTMRLELSTHGKHTYRAHHSWRINRTISAKARCGTRYRLQVNAAEQTDTGKYMDARTGHSHYKKVC